MRVRSLFPFLALALIASTAFADYGTPPPPPQPTPSSSAPGSSATEAPDMTSRRDAEHYFSDGYKDVVKAGKELEKGKKDNAIRKYQRALERCQRAVQLDSTYYEAWNLLGFTSRKLGDYPNSFAAYKVALRLKPDFALAQEYYGEGLLETGDLAGAKQQLAALRGGLPAGVEVLERNGTSTPELIAELEGAIAKYVAAHPEGVTMPAPAPPDTGATPTSGK